MVLEDRDGRRRVQRVPNRSPDYDRTLIMYRDIRVKAPWKIVGFLHTHPEPDDDPEPSQYDYENGPNRGDIPSVVYHPPSGSLVWYDKDGVLHREQAPKRSRVSRVA